MSTTQDVLDAPGTTAIQQGGNGTVELARVQITRRNPVPPGFIPWRPGQSGNPKGRPNAGAATLEWTNQMQSWSELQLREVMADKTAPGNKVAAARWWLDVRCQDRTKGGMPVASTELQHLLDRTLGRPVQQTVSTSTSVEFTFDLGAIGDKQSEVLDGEEVNNIEESEGVPRAGAQQSLDAGPDQDGAGEAIEVQGGVGQDHEVQASSGDGVDQDNASDK